MWRRVDGRVREREMAIEMAELPKKQGKPGLSGSDEALKIARIMDKYRKAAMTRENRAGAWIKPLEGYITRQNHDPIRIRQAGFEAWRDEIVHLLDVEKPLGRGAIQKTLKGA